MAKLRLTKGSKIITKSFPRSPSTTTKSFFRNETFELLGYDNKSNFPFLLITRHKSLWLNVRLFKFFIKVIIFMICGLLSNASICEIITAVVSTFWKYFAAFRYNCLSSGDARMYWSWRRRPFSKLTPVALAVPLAVPRVLAGWFKLSSGGFGASRLWNSTSWSGRRC
ncbi:hypothetical protein PGUG_03313 [Meyerozyma guilliermondii ATCC 6260]|uniref:Uncharacterized protein n=1 Tax=Meyerozyma guilliermondii (strain ATCC 6260 / CBS 566 / DSM 6381 / JCM 1539 / NBRC 10279 / NRRL Y-324) TaxID=294746 RepID=A5DJ62_PICGU|nr:uncharacterized protein PGUG_03313 [Meyerozyma guilliermondii ATCC 6260]EDK39215.2 hypothetical protein PGUG_03313 [Meyerozyma guilliermondii ATCC 6260]